MRMICVLFSHLLGISAIGCWLLISGCQVIASPGEGKDTKFIIVKNADMMRSDIYTPNAAVLITDKKTIARYVKLFTGNDTYGHACGYHYEISFWDSPESMSMVFPFNQECEEFLLNNGEIQDIMHGHRKVLETRPPAYLFRLKVPVSIPPAQLGKQLMGAGLFYVYLNGTEQHLPWITLRYTQVSPIVSNDRAQWQQEQQDNKTLATEKMQQIIAAVSSVAVIEDRSEISFPMQSFGGGEIEDDAEITLWFKAGTALSGLIEIIKSHGGTIEAEESPEYYYVHVVEQDNDLPKVQAKLKHVKGIEVIAY